MLASDPLDEGAHRRVMAEYAALGRRNRALEQYRRCRRDLIEAVGIEPAEETAALHARILAGRAPPCGVNSRTAGARRPPPPVVVRRRQSPCSEGLNAWRRSLAAASRVLSGASP